MNIKVSVKKLPKSEAEIEGELPAEDFEAYFPKALEKLGKDAELPGFRKGKVPESILLSKLGEMRVLEEAAEMAISDNYLKLLEENKIDAIGRPEISILKLARKNPLGFRIKTAVLPEIKLPDYREIARKAAAGLDEKEKNTDVTEKEVEDTIMDIRKSRAPKIGMKESAELAGKGEAEKPEGEAEPKEELPEFNDDFVRSLGPFKDIADFTEKLRENIKLEKINQLKEKTRLKIMEKILDKTEAEIPEILVRSEIAKIVYRMESDLSAMGLKFEDYLTQIKKTKEDMEKEFRPDAEKKAKLSLILNKIAEAEKLAPDEKQVAGEVAHILEHYKDVDPERAKIHAENVLTNEKVFQFLENEAEKPA
jgi:trigger factor